jgi:hypothetical protein
VGKYALAAAVLGLYIAGSSWIVGSEGRSYRRALLQKEAPPPGPAATAEPARDDGPTTAVAAREPAEVRPTPPPETEGPTVATAEAPREKRSEAPAPAPVEPATSAPAPAPSVAVQPAPPTPLPPSTPTGPTPGAPPAAAPRVPSPDRDPIWDAPPLKEVWDVDHLTTADEIRFGNALHDLILTFQRPLLDGPWQRRVEDVAEPLLKAVARKDIPYSFTILDSDAVNAFSTPGGHVYVCRGLFDMIAEDEDYALQFAVGHEIAHVDLLHAIGCLRSSDVKKLEAGTLQKMYMLILPFGYTDRQDFEADRWVFERMLRLDRSRLELLAFLRKFENYAKANGFENQRGRPDPGNPIDNHLRAHVIPRSRLKQLANFLPPAASKPSR